MGTNEYSQPASKSSWDSQDFGDVNMVVKMAHFHKSSRPQWVNVKCESLQRMGWYFIQNIRFKVIDYSREIVTNTFISARCIWTGFV